MITTLSLSPAVDKIYFVDDFKAGGLYRVSNIVKSAGGKGINVARVASILGETVCCLGFKAGDTGSWLESELKKLGVGTAFVEVKGESRTNNNIIDRASGTETEVLEIGPFIDEKSIEKFLGIFMETLPATDVLVCSGGLPEGVTRDFYRTLIDMAKPLGVKVILDTSNEMLEEGIKAQPYMIKPNLRELGRYAGKKLESTEDIVKTCREIIAGGVNTVVASLGGGGAYFVTGDLVLYSPVPRVEPVNTIGSGDSMVAGCAAALSRGYAPADILKLGMACAVANTQYMEIGYVSSEMVDRYIGEIIIEERVVGL